VSNKFIILYFPILLVLLDEMLKNVVLEISVFFVSF